jgi:23S rRNA (pseudouridine1915-N3)-methyltransferase
MKIRILSPGKKMPTWVREGFNSYAKRMPKECKLELHELDLGQRSKKNYSVAQVKNAESESFKKVLHSSDLVVALDVQGKTLSTEQLSQNLEKWLASGSNVSILIGGPDGLSQEMLDKANSTISLSKLTMPHALVRVMLAEQIYRACTLISGHPYHRA